LQSFASRQALGPLALLSYNIAGLISEDSQEAATQMAKIAVVDHPTLI